MQILKEYALQFVGTPYVWGGEHPGNGYDCSGLIQELLRSVGIDPPGDQTAQALYDHFEHNGEWNRRAMGTLLFFGRSVRKVTHVAMALDQYRMIEAGGAGRRARKRSDGIDQGGMVRVRLISSRKDLQAEIRPNYRGIGQL